MSPTRCWEVLRALRAVKQRKHLSASTLVRSYDSNGDDMVTAKELLAGRDRPFQMELTGGVRQVMFIPYLSTPVDE